MDSLSGSDFDASCQISATGCRISATRSRISTSLFGVG